MHLHPLNPLTTPKSIPYIQISRTALHNTYSVWAERDLNWIIFIQNRTENRSNFLHQRIKKLDIDRVTNAITFQNAPIVCVTVTAAPASVLYRWPSVILQTVTRSLQWFMRALRCKQYASACVTHSVVSHKQQLSKYQQFIPCQCLISMSSDVNLN